MFYESEIVGIIFVLVIAVFVIFKLPELKAIYAHKPLIAAFAFIAVGALATVIEEFLFYSFFNYLEHISYTVSAILLAIWIRKLSAVPETEK